MIWNPSAGQRSAMSRPRQPEKRSQDLSICQKEIAKAERHSPIAPASLSLSLFAAFHRKTYIQYWSKLRTAEGSAARKSPNPCAGRGGLGMAARRWSGRGTSPSRAALTESGRRNLFLMLYYFYILLLFEWYFLNPLAAAPTEVKQRKPLIPAQPKWIVWGRCVFWMFSNYSLLYGCHV